MKINLFKKIVYPERSRRGFTILEVLISAMVLVIAGVGVVLLEKQSIQSGTYNKHRLEATGLAQQGVNLTRQIFYSELASKQDSNTPVDWTKLGGPNQPFANPYWLDPAGGFHLTPGTETIYEFPGNQGMKYTRKIEITQ